jgi:hypothetical protein
MKTKQTGIVLVLLSILILILGSCYENTFEWFKQPGIPSQNEYIPDSLRFLIKDGSKITFVNQDSVIKSFYVKNESYYEPIINSEWTMQIGEIEIINSLSYPSDSTMALYISYYSQQTISFSYYKTNTNPPNTFLCDCRQTDFLNTIKIRDKTYYNVSYSDSCSDYFNGIYFNRENGIIKYVTKTKDTFELYVNP